jgi:hypothetical protein
VDKASWNQIQRNGMRADFSWNRSALGYQQLYEWAMARTLAIFRILVGAHAQKGGVAQQSVGGPLAKAHLAYIQRLHPGGGFGVGYGSARVSRSAGRGNRPVTGRLGANRCGEQRADFREQSFVEPRARASRVHKRTAHQVSQLQRAEV